jgi:hypothetical protein
MKCKEYNKQRKIYFESYFDIFSKRKTIEGINNDMEIKKNTEKEEKLLIMTNISIIKNVLTITHTQYRVNISQHSLHYFLRLMNNY